MTVARRVGCPAVTGMALSLLTLAAVSSAGAQGTKLRLLAVDMYGGVVWPNESEMGVAFGARVGVGTLLTQGLRIGVGLDWWTADAEASGVEIRDVVGRVDAWTELTSAAWIRPFVGLGLGLHSVDASTQVGSAAGVPVRREVEDLDGLKVGGSGFGGAAFQLTETGAIWILIEYRFAAVPDVAHHELRAGARLVTSRM